MADTAAHLVDRTLPEVPARQWVLTLPYPLRYRCAWNARLTSEVLRCFLRAALPDLPRLADPLGSRRGKGLARPEGDAPAGERRSLAAPARAQP